jgi:hypothetical protein
VRLLLILLDNEQEPRLKDSIRLLIKIAYDGSIMHSIDLDEYIEAIRTGHKIMEEARSRWLARHKSEALRLASPGAVRDTQGIVRNPLAAQHCTRLLDAARQPSISSTLSIRLGMVSGDKNSPRFTTRTF